MDGKISKNDFDEDLGLLCRLVISRAMASHRAKEACRNDDSANPDWENNLSQSMLLSAYNEDLHKPLLKKYNVGSLSSVDGYNNSTIHGSYIYDRQTAEQAGMRRSISMATYFCITANPKHYTPYFTVLKINKKIAEQSYVSNPSEMEEIFYQFPKLSPPPQAYKFLDFNQDGKKDLIVLREDFTRGYTIASCRYQQDQETCVLGIAKDYVKPDAMFVEPKLVLDSDKQVTIQFFKDDQKVAEASYEISGEEVKLTKKNGFK